MQRNRTISPTPTRLAHFEFAFAIRLFNEVREVLVVKATSKGDFYAFPPYVRIPNDDPSVDIHFSKHRSGERHLRWKVGGNRIPTPETIAKLQPTTQFTSVELFIRMPLFKGQFAQLPLSGTNRGTPVVLDADSAGFRDDVLAVCAYLVAPGQEDGIPKPANVGPYVRYVEKSVTPLVAVEVYQEAIEADYVKWNP